MIYAIDFDGTLCEHEYPNIGKPKHDIISFCKNRKIIGDKLILWTCRSNQYLIDAVEWCKGLGLEFDAINDNLPELNDYYGNNSRKVFADFYIDDRNILLEDVIL